MKHGGQCVMIVGTTMMLWWLADSWDMLVFIIQSILSEEDFYLREHGWIMFTVMEMNLN